MQITTNQPHLEIYNAPLMCSEIYTKWSAFAAMNNLGANAIFTGIVRSEHNEENENVLGLSFDIYMPLLVQWFAKWEKFANSHQAIIKMAHSQGDVLIGQSSYMAGIFSSKRKIVLKLFAKFIEDFKHNAPIWKYDILAKGRVYANKRSYKLPNSGILSD